MVHLLFFFWKTVHQSSSENSQNLLSLSNYFAFPERRSWGVLQFAPTKNHKQLIEFQAGRCTLAPSRLKLIQPYIANPSCLCVYSFSVGIKFALCVSVGGNYGNSCAVSPQTSVVDKSLRDSDVNNARSLSGEWLFCCCTFAVCLPK